MAKVRDVAPFRAMVDAPNALAIDGGARTSMLAEAVVPVPPSVETTALVVLIFVPAEVPVTFTENVHDELAANVPPERLTLPEPAIAVIVPAPQEPESPFGVATTRPAGSTSLNATPVREATALELPRLNDNVAEPPRGMLVALNTLAIVAGVTTVTEALDVLPAPPSVEVTVTLLFFTPADVPVTFTENVHEVFAARVAPERLMEPEAAIAVIAPPPQEPLRPFGVATIKPAGRLSVNDIPVSGVLFTGGLVMVKLREVEPFSGTVAPPNALVIVGGEATAMVAEAVLPVPPFVEVTVPVVLFCVPELMAVTLTENVHELLARIDAPVRLMELEAATAVIVPPPQEPLSPFGVATTKPAGKTSVKATPVRVAVFAAGFVTVKLRDVDAFTARLAAPNAFAITGGATT